MLEALKEKGWITTLSAGGGVSGSNYREFAVSCVLTQEGLDHVDEIIQSLFQTLNLIATQGLQAWRYQEKRAVLESLSAFKKPSAHWIWSAIWWSTCSIMPPKIRLTGTI